MRTEGHCEQSVVATDARPVAINPSQPPPVFHTVRDESPHADDVAMDDGASPIHLCLYELRRSPDIIHSKGTSRRLLTWIAWPLQVSTHPSAILQTRMAGHLVR